MKTFLLGLAVILTINVEANFSSELGGHVEATSRNNKGIVYSASGVKQLMNSQTPACFKLATKQIIMSKGYKAKGLTKALCTNKMSEKFGFIVLNKNSFDAETTILFLKKGYIK